MDLDSEILSYYSSQWDEDARLRSGLQEIELIRTQEIVRRFLPGGRLKVIDVGGGSGIHAEWLLADGHDVHLVEPVPRHIELATSRLGDHLGFTCEVGDARALTQAGESTDAVLLLGPVYHLPEYEDRLAAWSEALRVTKPGGFVFASAISRFSALASGLAGGLIFDQDFESLVRRTLTTASTAIQTDESSSLQPSSIVPTKWRPKPRRPGGQSSRCSESRVSQC